VETHFGELEKERSPRPILKLIGPIYFFAVREVGGRGVANFFGGWGDSGLFSGIAGPRCDL
jgi:hypothetical protein